MTIGLLEPDRGDVFIEGQSVFGAAMGKLPSQLSGGMIRRVGLARALVGRPPIVLYDDPTAGLDPVNAASVAAVVTRVNKLLSATSVMVTHDIKTALGMCDRVALLHGGRMRFVGTPQEFRNSLDPLVRAFVDRSVAAKLSLRELDRQVPA
jgi:phospholipid/cholesterol/gamma-HCH transport system ATP-binding protein